MLVLRGGEAVDDECHHGVGGRVDQDRDIGLLTLGERLQHEVRGILPAGRPPHADTDARSRRRDQDPAGGVARRSRSPGALRSGSAHARGAEPSAHRRDLRGRGTSATAARSCWSSSKDRRSPSGSSWPAAAQGGAQIAAQIADALDAAQQSGIVHRDLKPANIKITARRAGKGAGLRSGQDRRGPIQPPEMTLAATSDHRATRDGAVLGTAAYMSPEQARGAGRGQAHGHLGLRLRPLRDADRPAQPSIDRPSSDTIAAILEHDPDWRSLPASTPPSVRRLVMRCLEKDVARRVRDIGDVRIDIADTRASSLGSSDFAATSRRPSMKRVVACRERDGNRRCRDCRRRGVDAQGDTTADHEVTRLAVSLPAGDTLGSGQLPSIALSPDGRTMAYAASRDGRVPQLFVRRLDAPEATLLPGTEGARSTVLLSERSMDRVLRAREAQESARRRRRAADAC